MNRIPLYGPTAGPRLMLRALLATAGVVLALASIAAVSLTAAPGDDVLDARRGEIRSLEAQVLRIDADAGAAADAHAQALRRADDLRARIAETTGALTQARAARVTALERLSARIVALYGRQPPSLVEVMITSGSLSAAADAQEALERVAENDRLIVEQIEATKVRLARLRDDLLGDRAAAEASVVESASRLEDLQALIVRRRAVLNDAQTTLDGLVANDARQRVRQRAAAARAASAAAAVERSLLQRAAPAAATVETLGVAVPSAPSGNPSDALERIAQCESGGNPRAVSSSGQYRGKYQFDTGTWLSLGGSGDPAAAPEAEQDRIAAILYARSGAAPWPVCGYR